jgi:uncharacterized protein
LERVLPSFNIMAKPVCGTCNLRCRYCYYTSTPGELYPGITRFMMGDDVLESYVAQYMAAMGQRCDFCWQGGEPLLAGRGFYARALEHEKLYSRSGQVITNSLQTNGTLLDDPWCELLAEHGFLVGISLDGPPRWHDAFRRDRDDSPTFGRAWAGVEMLHRHGVPYNVLATLNSVTAPHAAEIYRYFVDRGIQYVQFIPVLERTVDGTIAAYSCTARQLGDYLCDVFRLWVSQGVGKVSERFIDGVLHQLIFGAPATCLQARRCAGAYVLEFNGDLYACDHFVSQRWRIGNILCRPLEELVTDPRVEEFSRLKTDLPSVCGRLRIP